MKVYNGDVGSMWICHIQYKNMFKYACYKHLKLQRSKIILGSFRKHFLLNMSPLAS